MKVWLCESEGVSVYVSGTGWGFSAGTGDHDGEEN